MAARDSKGRFVKGGPFRAEFKFNLRLKEVLAEVRANGEAAVHAMGTDAQAIAKRLAPEDTGEYADAIELVAQSDGAVMLVTEGGHGTRGSAEAGQGIGGHLEMGTKYRKATPHMIPAVIIAKDNIRDKIGRVGIVGPKKNYGS